MLFWIFKQLVDIYYIVVAVGKIIFFKQTSLTIIKLLQYHLI